MKKLTFLFVAAVMAVGANAQDFILSEVSGIGQSGPYNLLTQTFSTDVPRVNQEFTFAIKVTDATVLAWLNGGSNRTLALAAARFTLPGSANKDIRLEPQGDNVYAINLVLKQLFPDIDFSGLPDGIGTENYNEDNRRFHFNVLGAALPDDGTWTWDAWNHYGFVAAAKAAGTDSPAINGGVPELPGVRFPSQTPAGIEDVFANPQEVERIEYFNLQGMKLQAEPQEGLFIAVPYYKGGVRGEAVKVLNRR